MRKVHLIITILITVIFFGSIISAFADTPWSVKVTKRGGKSTPCGIKYKKVVHNQTAYKETITCTGNGNNDCPTPVHTAGESGIINIENAVANGSNSGTIVDFNSLTISVYADGVCNEDGTLDYNGEILIFETVEQLQSYIDNNE